MFFFFRNEHVGSNLLNSFNNLADTVSWTESSKNSKEVEEIASKFGPIFASAMKKIYSEHLKSVDAKHLGLELECEKIELGHDKLVEIYNEASSNIKGFLAFMFLSPKLVYEHYSKKYAEGVFDAELFNQYLKTQLIKPDVEALFGKFSIADCLTDGNLCSNLLTTFELSDVKTIELFWSTIDIQMNYGKTTGKTVSSFDRAVSIMQRIAPVWTQLKISSSTSPESDIDSIEATPVDTEASTDDIVAAYQGNYSVVPSNYPSASGIAFGLVSNFVNFNKLSPERKRQVSNFLLNNRSKFNSVLADSAKIISDSIETSTSGLVGTDFNRYGENSANVRRAASTIQSSYGRIKNADMTTKINYIVNCYLPFINKFKAKLMNDNEKYSHVLANINDGLQILGGGIYDDVDATPVEPAVVERKEEEIHEPVVIDTAEAVPFDSIYSLYGGVQEVIPVKTESMSAEEMVKEIVQLQKDFNRSYEELYRRLIKNIESIQLPSIYKESINTLYPYCKVFNDVAIKNPKTTVWISGLYGKKNRNNIYTQVVRQTIDTLKKSGYSCFNDSVSTLEALEKLLKDTNEKAKNIRIKFIRSPKASSEILLIAGKRVKIPCNLTVEDFNSFDMAINALYWQMRNNSSESSILSNKEEIKKYFDRMKNREDVIKQQFNILDTEIQFKSQKIEDISLRTMWTQVNKIMNEQLMKCCLYVNNVVEPQLTKQKLESVQYKNLTKSEVIKIENAFLMFKKGKMSTKYEEEFKLLNKMIKKNKDIFTIANQIKKIIVASKYIDFIATLYKEFHIFDDSFNWDQFTNMMLTFMVLNSLSIDFGYILPDITAEDEWTASKTRIQSIPSFIMSIAQYLAINTKGKYTLVEDFYKNLNEMNKPYDHGADFKWKVFDHAAVPACTAADAITAINNGIAAADQIPATFYNDKIFRDVIQPYLWASDRNNGADAAREIVQKPIEIVTNNFGISFVSSVNEATLGKTKNNNIIINAVFDSLFVNIVNLFDKYWSMRYSGNLPLPMGVNQMLKGGNVFDTTEFHDISTAEVIPEAVPFYITGLNVCNYYIKHLGKTEEKPGELTQRLKISELSILYPISEIFGAKYNVDIKMLSTAQLTTCIAILNDIWNQTSGSPSDKLSASIDMLLNELNASLFITDGIQNSLIENGYATMDTFSASAMNDVEKVLKVIESIYKSAAVNGFDYVSPEEELIGFERMLKKAYNRVKDISADMRMNELKVLLTKDEELNTNMNEYYKFMDLVISPLVTCYESYKNVFGLFTSIHSFIKRAAGNSISIDLKDRFIVMDDGTAKSMWDLIQESYDETNVVKYLTMNPVVQEWNTLLYNKMLVDYQKSGIIKAPQFWFVMDKNSYPTQSKLDCEMPQQMMWNNSTSVFRQLYPHINAKTMADYFEYTIREFASSVDQCLHLFMSYPGMKDKTVQIVEGELHDTFKADKILRNEHIQKVMDTFKGVEIKKSDDYIYPTHEIKASIPSFVHGDEVIPGIPVNQDGAYETHLEGSNSGIIRFFSGVHSGQGQIEGIMDSRKGEPAVAQYTDGGNSVYRNGWFDYVLYVLAKSNNDFVIPYKLAQMIKSDQILNQIAREMLNTTGKVWGYNATKAKDGSYLNPITMNIMTRSCTEYNKTITDPLQYGQETINNIISIIPFVLATLEGVKNSIQSSVMYHGIRVIDEINSSMAVLAKFYNDLSTSVSPITYLQEGATKYGKDHPLGEVIKYVNEPVASIQSYSALEWANKYKFSFLTSITYPEYKNIDRLEWIKEYAKNVFTQPVFSQNFKVIMENMANQVWNSVIASTYKASIENTKIPFITMDDSIYIRQLLGIAIYFGCTDKSDYQYILDVFFNNIGAGSRVSSDAIKTARNVMYGGIESDFKRKIDEIVEFMKTHAYGRHQNGIANKNARVYSDGNANGVEFANGRVIARNNIDFTHFNTAYGIANLSPADYGFYPNIVYANTEGGLYNRFAVKMFSAWEALTSPEQIDQAGRQTYSHPGIKVKAVGGRDLEMKSFRFIDAKNDSKYRAMIMTLVLANSGVSLSNSKYNSAFESLGVVLDDFFGKKEYFDYANPANDKRGGAFTEANFITAIQNAVNTLDVVNKGTDDYKKVYDVYDLARPVDLDVAIDEMNAEIDKVTDLTEEDVANTITNLLKNTMSAKYINDFRRAVEVVGGYINNAHKIADQYKKFFNDFNLTPLFKQYDAATAATKSIYIGPICIKKYDNAGTKHVVIAALTAENDKVKADNGNKIDCTMAADGSVTAGAADLTPYIAHGAEVAKVIPAAQIRAIAEWAHQDGNMIEQHEYYMMYPLPVGMEDFFYGQLNTLKDQEGNGSEELAGYWIRGTHIDVDGTGAKTLENALPVFETVVKDIKTEVTKYPTNIQAKIENLANYKDIMSLYDSVKKVVEASKTEIGAGGFVNGSTSELMKNVHAQLVALYAIADAAGATTYETKVQAIAAINPTNTDYKFYDANNAETELVVNDADGVAHGQNANVGTRLGAVNAQSIFKDDGVNSSANNSPVLIALKDLLVKLDSSEFARLTGGDLAGFMNAFMPKFRQFILASAAYAPNHLVAEFLRLNLPATTGKEIVTKYILYAIVKYFLNYVKTKYLDVVGRENMKFKLYNYNTSKIEEIEVNADRFAEATWKAAYNGGVEFDFDKIKGIKIVNTKKGSYIGFDGLTEPNVLNDNNITKLAYALIHSHRNFAPLSTDAEYEMTINIITKMFNVLLGIAPEKGTYTRFDKLAKLDETISGFSDPVKKYLQIYKTNQAIDAQHIIIVGTGNSTSLGYDVQVGNNVPIIPFVTANQYVAVNALNNKIDFAENTAHGAAANTHAVDRVAPAAGERYTTADYKTINMNVIHKDNFAAAVHTDDTYANNNWNGIANTRYTYIDGAAARVAMASSIWAVSEARIAQFDLIWLFNKIVGQNIELMTDVEASQIKNYGFLIPKKLTGGLSGSLQLLMKDNIEGNKPEEVMKNLYADQPIPYKIFMNLFNAAATFKTNEPSSIFNATIRYFHKFNISMSNVFNQLCYAQILMNSISMKDAMTRLSNVVSNLPDSEAKKQHFNMARKYILSSVGKDAAGKQVSLFDIDANDFKTVFAHDGKLHDAKRSEFVEDKYITTDMHGTDVENINHMKSIYKAPTANPNFMIDYLKFTQTDKYRHLLPMNSSNLMRLMHRLDLQCTYMDMLVILLRHTSYYDTERATEKSLFGDFETEPFDAI